MGSASDKMREAAKRESDLSAIEAVLGADARREMEAYLGIFDEKFYGWLAGLYDPATGALYYSNSAKENDGYLPDIESTTRGWGWLGGAGMLENYGGSLKAALPSCLVEKLLGWIIPLQSSVDGYFYHPQWGGTENVNRRGRDLDCATEFIEKLGGKQLYDGRNGTTGSLGAPLGGTTDPEKKASDTTPEHLKSVSAFTEYMEGLNWSNSYSSGHTLESQATQIRSAGPEFVDAFENFLGEKQASVQQQLRDRGEPENGLWEPRVSYNTVNGLMKICSAYSRLNAAIPCVEAAFESALQMVKHRGKDVDGRGGGAIVDVYNPWCAINHLITNTSKFGDPAVAERLRERLRTDAATLIKVTAEKNAAFKKPDGSFGYLATGGQSTSQWMPVAVEGVDEGDVNGATIATSAVMANMCWALGIERPQLYFNSDFERFMELIEAQNYG